MYLGQEDERTNGRTDGRTNGRTKSQFLIIIYRIHNIQCRSLKNRMKV
jgi:hypothetical protein